MALSTNEATSIQNRFLLIERKLNEIQTALNNLATKAQSRSLLNIRQNEIIEIQEMLEQLERVNGAILLDVHEADTDAHASVFAEYYKKGDFIDSTNGIIDAGKPLKLDSDGKLDPSLVELSFEDHSTLSGLNGDDHLQYHTDTRGDARYYLQSQVDIFLGNKSDTSHTHHDLYYTEGEVNTLLSGYSEVTHLHDNRYYTESETDSLLNNKSDTSHLHDSRYYTEIEIDTLLTSYTVTGHDHDDLYYTDSEVDAFLATKSTVGHNHNDDYYTEIELDTGQLNTLYYTEDEIDTIIDIAFAASGVTNGNSHDHSGGDGAQIDHGGLAGLGDDDHSIYHTDARGDARYYTESELDAGQLDNRYYTESEVDTIASGINHGDLENIGTDDHHAQLHTIASHSDTTATGAELETLTNNSIADSLHRHSELVASDGSPDPVLLINADGKVGIGISPFDVGGLFTSPLLLYSESDHVISSITTNNTAKVAAFRFDNNSADKHWQIGIRNSTDNYGFQLSHHDGTSWKNPALWVDTAGKIGVGIEPTEWFHVYNSTTSNTVALFESSDPNANIFLKDSNTTASNTVGIGATGDTLILMADSNIIASFNHNLTTLNPFTTDNAYIGTGGGNIIFTSPIVTGPIYFDTDTGPTVLFDMPVTSTSSAGDEMSVAFAIDSNTIATVYAQADGADGIQAPSFKIGAARFQESKGSDVASADEITLGDGNYFDITGTTTINHINKTNWQAGSVVTLQFDASLIVTHNAASPTGTEASILLAGASNFSATTNDTLTLIFDGTTFREIGRTVI